MDKFIFHKTNLETCENFSHSSLHRLSPGRSFFPVRKKLSSLYAHVNRDSRAILRAALAATSNGRIYMGAWMIAVLCPLAEVMYHFFDPRDYDPSGYYGGPYWYFYSIGPHVSGLLLATGFFLLMPPLSRAKYLALIPAGYRFAKILWVSQVTTNEEFHQIVPGSFILTGILIGIVWLIAFDWLMDMHFHKREGIIARIIGIMSSPGISAEDKERLSKDQIKNLDALHHLY